jgi:predicted nucleic acid-binding Zn ribbon protein
VSDENEDAGPAAASGSGASGSGASEQPPGKPLAGAQLARAALDAARAAGRTYTTKPGAPPRQAGDGQSGRRRRWSGAGPDPRDPQPLGRLVRRLVSDRGWEKPAAEARVLGDWPNLVGPDIASKSKPVSLRDGELTLQAESTAWATQLRLLSGKLLGILSSELGPGVVKKIHVHGPAAPSWKKGRLSVRGRGPRDTYG